MAEAQVENNDVLVKMFMAEHIANLQFRCMDTVVENDVEYPSDEGIAKSKWLVGCSSNAVASFLSPVRFNSSGIFRTRLYDFCRFRQNFRW